jgi:predicted nucleic acid-binding protein
VTASDAVYLVLAEVLSAPLLACDARLAAVPGHRAQVELVTRA